MSQSTMNCNLRTPLSDREIVTKIWFSPRVVFRLLNDGSQANNHDGLVKLLLFLGGISRAFDRAMAKDFGDKLPLLAIIAICVVMGGLFGWISFYIYALFMSWTGKWLKGTGNTASILRVMAYSMIPSACGLILLVVQIFLFGNGMFESDFDLTYFGLFKNVVFWSCLILEIALFVWSTVLFVVGVSEAQKFSIGKSILNILMPGLLLVALIFLIALLVK